MAKSILITGASSGLGAALAVAYAQEGATLFLSGRDSGRLNIVVSECKSRAAEVHASVKDVTDAFAMQEWVQWADETEPLDLVIANAGVSGGTAGGTESTQQVYDIIQTNMNGVLHTVQPVIPAMQARQSGQLALVSSLAGFRGLPTAPAYSTSKVAVRAYGEAMRPWLAQWGIGVSVICPGFIQTPMTDVNQFDMPLIIQPDKAAAMIKAGLAKNKARIAFPWPLYAASRLLSVLPLALSDAIVKRMPGK